jgi:hypothetical protein
VPEDNAVGSCILMCHSDGAIATAYHVWEAATDGGSTVWVALTGPVAPFQVELLRLPLTSDLALLVPTSRSELQLPSAVVLWMGAASVCTAQ